MQQLLNQLETQEEKMYDLKKIEKQAKTNDTENARKIEEL